MADILLLFSFLLSDSLFPSLMVCTWLFTDKEWNCDALHDYLLYVLYCMYVCTLYCCVLVRKPLLWAVFVSLQ